MGGAPAFSRAVATNTSRAFLAERHLRGRRLAQVGGVQEGILAGVPHTEPGVATQPVRPLYTPACMHAAGIWGPRCTRASRRL